MSKNPAAVALGKLTSKKKAAAARRNGKKGGAPKRFKHPVLKRLYIPADCPWHHEAKLVKTCIGATCEDCNRIAP